MKQILGGLLVLFAVVVVVLTFFPIVKNEVSYQVKQITNTPEKELTPLYPDFGIVINKLDINAKVVKDVDPYQASIYQKALTQGVAHAKGTALPGEDGNIFIFSHSSENFYEALHYNSIFYLLPKLEVGDIITLYYQDKPFNYTVSEKKIVNPQDVSYLQKKSSTPQLTLMTCYPPGTDFKRYIIIAKNITNPLDTNTN